MQRRDFMLGSAALTVAQSEALALVIAQPNVPVTEQEKPKTIKLDGLPEGLEIVRFGVPAKGELHFSRSSTWSTLYQIFLHGFTDQYLGFESGKTLIVIPKNGYVIEFANETYEFSHKLECVKLDNNYEVKTIHGIMAMSQKQANMISKTIERTKELIDNLNISNSKARL